MRRCRQGGIHFEAFLCLAEREYLTDSQFTSAILGVGRPTRFRKLSHQLCRVLTPYPIILAEEF